MGIQSLDRPARSESLDWLCYPGSFPWVWGLSSSCDNLSMLRKVKYEIDASIAGMRQKWPNARLSCSFSIQMERLSHTITNLGKSKTNWDLGHVSLEFKPTRCLHYLTAITCHFPSPLYYMWAVEFVGYVNTTKCDTKWQPADGPTEFYCYISPPGEEKKEMPYFIRVYLSISLLLKTTGVWI